MNREEAHVLYVDDDEALRRLAEKSLARRGFRVAHAASGVEGIERARETRFDVIAIDHYMPGQDGLATLEALQAMPGCPPVIYVTGSDETRIAVAALKAGAADYVIKTVGSEFFELLANSFRQALEQQRLRQAKEAADEELRASHARLEALLREVNHRVANSLNLVSSIVHLQAATVDEPGAKTALNDTQQRIQAIAQVHRRLYSSGDVTSVAMDDYLECLCRELEQTWSTKGSSPRRLKVDADPVRFRTRSAVSLGIIINELVSNAWKYAYEPSAEGEIRVSLRTVGPSEFILVVEDDGPGLPSDGQIQGTGLGTKLVKAMAVSLQAEVEVDLTHRGTRVVVRGPLELSTSWLELQEPGAVAKRRAV